MILSPGPSIHLAYAGKDGGRMLSVGTHEGDWMGQVQGG